MIDIHDLDKAEVLVALFNASKPQGMGFLHYDPKPLTVEHARAALDRCSNYVDYLEGRVIKVNFATNTIDSRLYDRDLGPGAAARAIDKLRQQKAREQADANIW